MMMKIIRFFFQPHIFGLGITAFCLFALSAAFTAEYVFGLKPCILCLYQRIPFAINALLGVLIYKLHTKHHPGGTKLMLYVAGLVFLVNSALAFYHTGVEQLWWESVLEGCQFDPTNLRDAMYEPPVPCNQIPWQDPILGLSMANWNILVCGVAGIKTLVCATMIKKADA